MKQLHACVWHIGLQHACCGVLQHINVHWARDGLSEERGGGGQETNEVNELCELSAELAQIDLHCGETASP